MIKIWNGETATAQTPRPEDFEITYVGATISTFEHNWADDSDFCALVWDDAEGRLRTVQYATTRGWTYNNSAKVDATPDVLKKAEEFLIKLGTENLIEDHSRRVDVGSQVKSLTTRGKAKGLAGEVIRIKDSDYGPGKIALVDGIKDDEPTRAWVDTARLEITTKANEDECRERVINRIAAQGISSCYRAIGYGAF